MKKFLLSILFILLIASPGLGQFGQLGGGISGISLVGSNLVFGAPLDSVIFEIPVSAEASFTFETLIGTVFKIFNAAGDSMILNPNGFSSSNSAVAGTAVFNYKSRGGHSVIIDSLSAYASIMDSPTENAALMQLGTSADADRFKVDEDGDVTNDGTTNSAGGFTDGTATIDGSGNFTGVGTFTFGNGTIINNSTADLVTITEATVDIDGASTANSYTSDVDVTATNDVIGDSLIGNTGLRTGGIKAATIVTSGNVISGGTLSIGGATPVFEDIANYATSPDFVMTDTDVNLRVDSHVQAIDTASVYISAAGADAWIAVRAYKTTQNMLELIADASGIIGDSTTIFNKYGHLISTSVSPAGVPLNHSFADSVGVTGLIAASGGFAMTSNTAFPGTINNRAIAYFSSANGLVLGGEGATFDIIFVNMNGDGVFVIPTGTQTASFLGDVITAAYNRTATLSFNDCFDRAEAVQYAQQWDINALNVSGTGSNVITTTPSHITLTTDGVGINENEGTRSNFAFIQRARKNRSEWCIELGQTAQTNFYLGWNVSGTNVLTADTKYVLVVYEVGQANWQLWIDNGAGGSIDKYVSSTVVNTDEIIFELYTETDGTIHWFIDGVEETHGLSELMQADNHFLILGQLEKTEAAIISAEIDYIENEKFK